MRSVDCHLIKIATACADLCQAHIAVRPPRALDSQTGLTLRSSPSAPANSPRPHPLLDNRTPPNLEQNADVDVAHDRGLAVTPARRHGIPAQGTRAEGELALSGDGSSSAGRLSNVAAASHSPANLAVSTPSSSRLSPSHFLETSCTLVTLLRTVTVDDAHRSSRFRLCAAAHVLYALSSLRCPGLGSCHPFDAERLCLNVDSRPSLRVRLSRARR
ncbi:hypothetical protein K466DRAFT_100230 [Polyporus arcularius HHB13444]|uniref:Uncharacterized protein n=1 Tax=Polyporus arcularius HHB13444 TaxID=1314778 RepID=A0A5C3PXL9_9APHY|nr:hypothetical protein K466DRAFT_100230 [Polyporus arcularius HHB13444]